MIDRVALKTNAKKILRRNYWWAVLVALILGIASGQGTGLQIDRDTDYDGGYTYNSTLGGSGRDGIFGMGQGSDYRSNMYPYSYEYYQKVYAQIQRQVREFLQTTPIEVLLFYGFLILIGIAIALAIDIFLLNPLVVGCRRWLILNRREKPFIDEIAYAFRNGYGNVVKIMFFRNLYLFLWALLLFFPAVVKAYEYRMVPYLLAENPHMSKAEAFQISRKLMAGKKWETFIFDLSFIGWRILASLTWGILTILYVAPYMALAGTELYVYLCQGATKYREETLGLEK